MAKKREINTPETVGNQFGYLCPKCKQGDDLYVESRTVVGLCDDGTFDVGDQEWDGNSGARCGCGWAGRVDEFMEAENFEAD
jgi:hypothetical protein